MKPSEEQWNRWIDGELSPDEVEALKATMDDSASLEADQAFFSRLSHDLKASFPAEQSPPFADFFNSHLQKQIRDLNEAGAVAPAKTSWWPSWLNLTWAAPLAAAALVVLTLMQIGVFRGKSGHGSQIVYAYTPDDSIQALTNFNDDANAMVVRLEGIARLPAEFDLILADADGNDAQEPFIAEAESADIEAFEFVGPRPELVSNLPVY